MNTLTLLLALIGQSATLWTPDGACDVTIVAPGQALVTDGSCSLDAGALYVGEESEEAVGTLTHARTLDSGRVLVSFRVSP